MHRSGEEVLIAHIDVDRDYEIRSEVVANFDVGDKGTDRKVVGFPRVEPVVDGRVSPRSRDGLVCALLDDLACFAEGVQPRLVSEVILASFFFTGPDGTGGVEDDGVQVDFCCLFLRLLSPLCKRSWQGSLVYGFLRHYYLFTKTSRLSLQGKPQSK